MSPAESAKGVRIARDLAALLMDDGKNTADVIESVLGNFEMQVRADERLKVQDSMTDANGYRIGG